MEELFDGIERSGEIFSRRMPIRISHVTDRTVGLRIEFLNCIMIDDIGSAIGGTHVKHHLIGILHAETVTVHTVVTHHIIADDGLLIVGGQVALVDADDMPFFITRLNQSINEVRIDLVRTDKETERHPSCPFAGFQ